MNPHQRITYDALKQNGFRQGAIVAAIIASTLFTRKFFRTFKKRWTTRASERLVIASNNKSHLAVAKITKNLWQQGVRSIKANISVMDKVALAKTIAARSAWFLTVASMIIDALDLASDAMKFQTSSAHFMPFALTQGAWDETVSSWSSVSVGKLELGALIIVAWDCGERRRAETLCTLYDGLDEGQSVTVTIPALITIEDEQKHTLLDKVIDFYSDDAAENDLAIDCAIAFLPVSRSVRVGKTAIKTLKSILISM